MFNNRKGLKTSVRALNRFQISRQDYFGLSNLPEGTTGDLKTSTSYFSNLRTFPDFTRLCTRQMNCASVIVENWIHFKRSVFIDRPTRTWSGQVVEMSCETTIKMSHYYVNINQVVLTVAFFFECNRCVLF